MLVAKYSKKYTNMKTVFGESLCPKRPNATYAMMWLCSFINVMLNLASS